MDEPPPPPWTAPPARNRAGRGSRAAVVALLALSAALALAVLPGSPPPRRDRTVRSLGSLLRSGGDGGGNDAERRARTLSAARGGGAVERQWAADDGGDGDPRCDASCCSELLLDESLLFPETERKLQTDGPTGTGTGTGTGTNQTDCPGAGGDPDSVTSSLPKAVTWILVVFLVCMSALFSGLTLGLMGLDKTGLEIVMEGDNLDLSRAARKIYPVRSDGNRLLCTLLLGNVAVNALLSILMADIAGGLAGFLVSTAVIVIFGEILPQALCSRYALQIGSRTVPLIKFIMLLMWPLAGPLGWALDKLLGHELGTTYSKAEMTKLLEIHVKEGRFNAETGTAMTGALKYQDVTVKEVMTPLEHTYMLSADERLGYDTISEIFKTGYSRIPVYEVSVNNIIGLLFTKDLIFIDPEDETPVRSFVDIFGRGLHVVWPDDRLGDVLRDLKTGHSHMALVRDVNNEDETQDPFYEIKGIITLEDIIEVIIGDDIVDETDAFVDASHSIKVSRSSADFDWARLRLLDAKLVDETLAEEEVRAVTAHLRTNYSDAVALLSDRQLTRLVSETPVTELQEAEQEVGDDLPRDLLYERDVPAAVCTLLLGGKVTVLAGSDNFRADVSSWSVLAPKALTDPKFAPDFTAYVSSGPCRCLRFTRDRFMAAVDASTAERYCHPATPQRPSVVAGTGMDGGSQHQLPPPPRQQTPERVPNHSVTVDMDKKDVTIGLPESDVVIDVDDFDKVKITKGAAAEKNGEVAAAGVSVTAGGDETDGKSSSRVIFHLVGSQEEKPAGQRSDADVASDVAEGAVAKRATERKLKHRHRSRLLDAFLKKRASASDVAAADESASAEKEQRAFGRKKSTASSKDESASGDREEVPTSSSSPSHTASSQSAAPSSPKASPDVQIMSPLQAKLTDGGSYAPKPSNVSSGSSLPSGSTRKRSGSFQKVESSARKMSTDDKEQ